MNQRAQIISKIQKASSLAEQAALVSELDRYDRLNREASAQARSIDMTDTIVRQTLQPVAVHERSTINTDWLGEMHTASADSQQKITVEAAMWYRRLSPEVKADSEEFAEQARGMARRTASAHGEMATALEKEFLQYVSFLRSREAASGLPQVQQLVDPMENTAPTPLPTDVFDNFAPPVAPINEGTVGTETSERAPGMQMARQDAGGAQQETHHMEVPNAVPGAYSEMPAGGPMDASFGSEPPLYEDSDADEGEIKAQSMYVPTVAINQSYTMDDFRRQAIFGEYDRVVGGDHCAECGRRGGYGTPGANCRDCGHTNDEMGLCPSCIPGRERSDWEREHMGQIRTEGKRKEAASGLDQVQQVVDSFEEPDETSLPTDVMFPWLLGPDNGGQTQAQTGPQQPQVNPNVENRRMNIPNAGGRQATRGAASFPGLNKQADQWSQSGPEYKGPDAANSPATTVPPLPATGSPDWPEGAPDFADASSTIPAGAAAYAEGYEQAMHANPVPGAATPGQMPPGAGGLPGYQTHAKVANQYIKKDGDQWVITQKGTGKILSHHDSEEKANEAFSAMEMNKHGGSKGIQNEDEWAAYMADKDAPEAFKGWIKNDPEHPDNKQASLRVSASFTSPMDEADPEFRKAYKYATKWTPATKLVRTGSAAFEAGLYAGISDSPAQQSAWVQAHRKAAQRWGADFDKRIVLHREFTKQAAKHTGLKVEGAYLKTADGDGRWVPENTVGEGDQVSREHMGETKDGFVWKTAGTVMDLDTMAPQTSPSPTGQTPINGEGVPGPLAGDGQNPARPGGPSPYQGAEPFGQPAVPTAGTATGQPQAISDVPGAPVDSAALEHLSPQTLAFRKRVQASVLASRTAAENKVPVCRDCGEAFDSRNTANEAHGAKGCKGGGYQMTKESEAW